MACDFCFFSPKLDLETKLRGIGKKFRSFTMPAASWHCGTFVTLIKFNKKIGNKQLNFALKIKNFLTLNTNFELCIGKRCINEIILGIEQ